LGGNLLDTTIASHVIKGDRPDVLSRLVALPMSSLAVSAVTEAELLFGVAKRGHPPALSERVRQFLLRINVLDWGRRAAAAYAALGAGCEQRGVNLAPFDMMIAAHAIAAEAVLVTRDGAFNHVGGDLRIEDWTRFEPRVEAKVRVGARRLVLGATSAVFREMAEGPLLGRFIT
jgi:tRNA(fMet)-specific endonuclease VapC